jgi:ParB family chromosome partitioning protein
MSFRVDKIRPNGFNPNVMPPEEYAALKRDMQQVGPQGTGPILLSSAADYYAAKPELAKEGGFIIVDGEHRWRVAKELEWPEVRAETRKMTEDQAKAVCYRANREHGNLDPFKEAALFKSDLDNGMTQEGIAEKYLIDPSTVSHRLSLIKLSPDVVEEAKKMPRGKLTVSHLEPLATLPEPDQKLVMRDIKQEEKNWHQTPSVRDVEAKVERLKKQREMQRKLQSALSKSKHKKCPKCGKPPVDIYQKGLPWVECESRNYDHTWNLDTGKLLYPPTPTGRSSEPRTEPSTLRSNHTVQDIQTAFTERFLKPIFPQIEIKEVRVQGKLNGQKFDFDLNNYEHAISVSLQYGRRRYPEDYQGFRAEEHAYRTGEVTTVHCGNPKLIEKTKEFIERAFRGELVVISNVYGAGAGLAQETHKPLKEKPASQEKKRK